MFLESEQRTLTSVILYNLVYSFPEITLKLLSHVFKESFILDEFNMSINNTKKLSIIDIGISDSDWNKINGVFQSLFESSCGIITSSGAFLIGKQNQSLICKLIQSNIAGKKACKNCHASIFSKNTFRSEKVILFKCHVGLTQFILPISDEVIILSPGLPFNPIETFDIDQLSKIFGFEKRNFINIFNNYKYIDEVEFLIAMKLCGTILSNSIKSMFIFPKSETISSSILHVENKTALSRTKYRQSIFRSKKRRVVVTGMGIVSPLGIGKNYFLESLRRGKSGIKRIENFNPEEYNLPCHIAGEVKNFRPENFGMRKHTKGRSIQLAVAAARMAFEDAKLLDSDIDVFRAGVSIGTSSAGMEFAETEFNKFILKKRVSHLLTITVFGGAASGAVSISLGFKGPNLTVSTGCVASTDSIGYATQWIRENKVDIAAAGGSEALITPFIMTSFGELRVLSTNKNVAPEKACRPFDFYRDGLVISEGSGVLILEELEHALSRKAHIYGEILGYAATGDAFHMTQPNLDGDGAVRAMNLALLDANLTSSSIDYISAHGTSTKHNDIIETKAIKKVFGKNADKTPVSAIKSMTGHTMGASGSIELIGVLLSMADGFIPPTINQEKKDEDCDLDYVPNVARIMDINTVMKNSFAFGGKNASLIVRKYNE